MGAYLSQPVRTKEVIRAENTDVVAGGAAMQGWRRTMEDAHIVELGLGGDPTCHLLAVFDGHGGGEVAKFCEKYMAQEIQQLKEWNQDDTEVVEEALVQVFHRMDEMLRDGAFADEIEGLKARDQAEEDEDMKDEGEGGPMDALEMLKRVFQLKRFIQQPAGMHATTMCVPCLATSQVLQGMLST